MFNLFRRCRQDEISFDIVAKNGNNVEAALIFFERIVQLVASDNVAGVERLKTETGANAFRDGFNPQNQKIVLRFNGPFSEATHSDHHFITKSI